MERLTFLESSGSDKLLLHCVYLLLGQGDPLVAARPWCTCLKLKFKNQAARTVWRQEELGDKINREQCLTRQGPALLDRVLITKGKTSKQNGERLRLRFKVVLWCLLLPPDTMSG